MSNMTVDVLDAKGKKAGKVELPASLFDVQTNIPLIHQVVVAQLAAARQGTAATKTRGEVSGGGRKPWRQKGTGRARHGSTRSPIWVGGGVSHGPQPRNYSQRTPKKMVAAALRGALSDRARDGQVFVIKELVSGDKPSTRGALETLAKFGDLRKVLLVLDRFEDIAWLSVRNAVDVHALSVDQLNTYDVLVNDQVVFTEAALAAFIEGPAQGKSAKAVATESEAAAAEQADKPAAKKLKTVEVPAGEKRKVQKLASTKKDEDEPKDKPLKALPKEELDRLREEREAEEGKSEPAKIADVSDDKDEAPKGGAYRGDNPPKAFVVKGNEDSGKYHTPDSPWYDRTVAEVWFKTAEDAEAAGFEPVSTDSDEEKDK